MTFQDIYNDPTIYKLRKGDSNDPFLEINQTDVVRNNRIILNELPNKFNGNTISDGTNSLSVMVSYHY
jgi:hypothetical protein